MSVFYDLIARKITPDSNNIAIIDSELKEYTYAALYHKIQEIEESFAKLKLTKNSILIVQLDKSFSSLSHLLACIKLGIVYIPIDVNSPASRVDKIRIDSKANAILTPDFSITILSHELRQLPSDLVCVLYTSGSTGIPKGVPISSHGLEAFISWGLNEFEISDHDKLVAYAPFHFDLSTFDLFVGLTGGASVWLIQHKLASNFKLLSEYADKVKPTVWYATPTVLNLLNQYGGLSLSNAPRLVLFAGELFPIKQLNALRQQWKSTTYYNLYGPTETNVCTYFKLPKEIETDRTMNYPIGESCPYAQTKIGQEEELLVSGATVMENYFNSPSDFNQTFIVENGVKWLKTGDKVKQINKQLFYVGRLDRMVKKNGFRIELGEIENNLIQHPEIKNVIAIPVEHETQTKIVAYYTGKKQSFIALKLFSANHLLDYMIPDQFIFLEDFPLNKNGKIDYFQLTINLKKDE